MAKVNIEEETDTARELFFSQMDTAWQTFNMLKRNVKIIPPSDLEDLTHWWLAMWFVEISTSSGLDLQDIIKSVTTAHESMEEDEDENEPTNVTELVSDSEAVSTNSTSILGTYPPSNEDPS